ncbi:MAG: beta-galactosidase [Bacteroidales bacterium]|nr:beta-galactosidase [Bacteroidales bacterium]
MKVFTTLSLLAICILIACQTINYNTQKNSIYVGVDNSGHLLKDGKYYYYVGTNFWYGAILASQGEGGDRNRLNNELDLMQKVGIDNLRILVGGDGEVGLPSRIRPTLQYEPGVYNDTLLDGLDYLLYELDKRDMKAVLYLNNSWEWSGGYSVYLQWAGYGKAPIPSVDGWPTYMRYVKQYMKSDSAKLLFDNHIRYILSRTNRYTNRPYTEDPAIMSWQIGNEPRCFDDNNKDAFVEWISHTAKLIAELDTNHLISIGSEGIFGCEDDITLYDRLSADPNIDYLNIHIWPYNWGWAKSDSLESHLQRSKANTAMYIDDHLVIADKYNKPLVLEEFGFPRDSFQFSLTSSTNLRDEYYRNIFNIILLQARRGGHFAGCNFWAWGGEAKPQHTFWELGDPYTGDPAQEEQGLNSVFADDSTLTLVEEINSELAIIRDGESK